MPQSQISATRSPIDWPQLLEEVYKGRQTYEFKKGFNIPLHSHDIWIVYRGVVQLGTLHYDGNEALLGLAYPEIPFGLPLTQIFPYTTTALSDVVLMRVSQIELEQSSMLAQGISLQLNRRLQQTEALLALVLQRYVRDRLEGLLLLLGREIGEQTPDGMRIGIRLTHQQIADLVGVTRVTVTRILGYFYKEGWLSIDNTRHIVIHNSGPGSKLGNSATDDPGNFDACRFSSDLITKHDFTSYNHHSQSSTKDSALSKQG